MNDDLEQIWVSGRRLTFSAAEYIEDGPAIIAARMVRDLTPEYRDRLAATMIGDAIAGMMRGRARAEEQRAIRAERMDERRSRTRALDGMQAKWEAEHPGIGWSLHNVIAEWERTVRDETRLEVTAELLASRFALGDGRMVTWGEATAAEHEERIELLRSNVIGNLETIVVHQAALALMERQGVPRLGDVERRAA